MRTASLKAGGLGIAALVFLGACDKALDKAAEGVAAVTQPSNSVALCTTPVRKEIAFTAPDAKDSLEIVAVGADCKQASILATIRSASGELLWARAESAQMTMHFATPEESPETPEHALQTQMAGWADSVEIKTSADAPTWKQGDERPSEPTGLFIGTDFPRDQYLAVKEAKQPMLCHMIYMLRTQCLIYFPGNGAPGYATEYYDLQS